ncbi:putative leucine rich repeat protein [Neospora caninum Liverpool]|uniref:Leucine rich repeat protein, putative n=1 Tax=Neospora caninum (strain Liverpool) TaxID=572307 RepID=F0VN21_NEOCL|nr:putative leucine rich repeat protein [Neospora caninum Liverpool]CBZ55117.1 putative leucine rich repeat protein [Neospora caninum Liverpool]CEL69843.1 TPA: leucine rich repeat protein, putative [Neospora caninum Liverpool]|eukprot:XP_003885145.1 putative leucine rich repeat protein [Neospora caninum Liverpool]
MAAVDTLGGAGREAGGRAKGERARESGVSVSTTETMSTASPSYSSLSSASSHEASSSSDPSSPSTPSLQLAAPAAVSPPSPASARSRSGRAPHQTSAALCAEGVSFFALFLSPSFSATDLLCLLLRFLSLHDILDRLLPAARVFPLAVAFRAVHRRRPPERLRPVPVDWALPLREGDSHAPPPRLSAATPASPPDTPSVTFYTPPSSRRANLYRLTLTPQHLSLLHRPSLPLLLSRYGGLRQDARSAESPSLQEGATETETLGGGHLTPSICFAQPDAASAETPHTSAGLAAGLEARGWEIDLACFSLQHWKFLRAHAPQGVGASQPSPRVDELGKRRSEKEASRGASLLMTSRRNVSAEEAQEDPELKLRVCEAAAEGPVQTQRSRTAERQRPDAAAGRGRSHAGKKGEDIGRTSAPGLEGEGDSIPRGGEERRTEFLPLLAAAGELSALRISASEINLHAVKVVRDTVGLAVEALEQVGGRSPQSSQAEGTKETSLGDRCLSSSLTAAPASPPGTVQARASSSRAEEGERSRPVRAPLGPVSAAPSEVFAAFSLHLCGVSVSAFRSLCVSVLPLLGARLRRLSLTNCRLEALDMSSLSLALPLLPRLESLDLSDNLLRDAGAMQVLLSLIGAHRVFAFHATAVSRETPGRGTPAPPRDQQLADRRERHFQDEGQPEEDGDSPDDIRERPRPSFSRGRVLTRRPLVPPEGPGKRFEERSAARLVSLASPASSPHSASSRAVAGCPGGLLSLNLSGNDIEGVPLFRALLKSYVGRHAPNLEVLDLSNNKLDGETVILLRAAVARRKADAAYTRAWEPREDDAGLSVDFCEQGEGRGPRAAGEGEKGVHGLEPETGDREARSAGETTSLAASSGAFVREGSTCGRCDGSAESERRREAGRGEAGALSSSGSLSVLEREEDAGEETEQARKGGGENGGFLAARKDTHANKRRRSEEASREPISRKRRPGIEAECWQGLVVDLRENFCRCVNSSSGETLESHARRPVGCLGVIDNTLFARERRRRGRRRREANQGGETELRLTKAETKNSGWQCGFLLDICDCHLRERRQDERHDSPPAHAPRTLESYFSSWAQSEREQFLRLLGSDASFAADVFASGAVQGPEKAEEASDEGPDEVEARRPTAAGDEAEILPADGGHSGASACVPRARAPSPLRRAASPLPTDRGSPLFLSLSPMSPPDQESGEAAGFFSVERPGTARSAARGNEADAGVAAFASPSLRFFPRPARQRACEIDLPRSAAACGGPGQLSHSDEGTFTVFAPPESPEGLSGRVSPRRGPGRSPSSRCREAPNLFLSGRVGGDETTDSLDGDSETASHIPCLGREGVVSPAASYSVGNGDASPRAATSVSVSVPSSPVHSDLFSLPSSSSSALARPTLLLSTAPAPAGNWPESKAWCGENLVEGSSGRRDSLQTAEDRESWIGRCDASSYESSDESGCLRGCEEEDEEEEEDGDGRCFLFRGRACGPPVSVLLRKRLKHCQKRVSDSRREPSLSPRTRLRARLLRRLVSADGENAERQRSASGRKRKNEEGTTSPKRYRGDGGGSEDEENPEHAGEASEESGESERGEKEGTQPRRKELDPQREARHRQMHADPTQWGEEGAREAVERPKNETRSESREASGALQSPAGKEDEDESYDEDESEEDESEEDGSEEDGSEEDESEGTDTEEDVDEDEVTDLLMDAAEEVEECFSSGRRRSGYGSSGRN